MLKNIYLLCSFLLCQFFALAQDIPSRPNPARTVNDLVGILSADEALRLERKLQTYMDSTSTQIVLVTVKTVGDYAMDDVAVKIMREWGVGQKEKNNGVVLLCAMEDRKVFIATGYGLEGALPDMICRRIIDNDIKPAFREKQYFVGFDAATTTIIKRASGEFEAEPSDENGSGSDAVFIIIIMLVIFFIIFKNSNKGGNTMVSRRGHGSWNNGGGWWMTGGGGGYYDNHRRGGNDDDSWGGGGGFDFGGGSGGGGGAGGDW